MAEQREDRLRSRVTALLRHQALIEVLVARELKARYRGTALGFLWSFATPLINVAIYVTVFRSAFRVPEPHYAAFVLCGLLPWQTFVVSVTEGMGALIANGNLIKKVRLPAEVFVCVAVLHNLVHLLLSLPVLLAVLYTSDLQLGLSALALPLLLLMQLTFTLGVSLVLSSLAVQFRDLLHIVPNLLTMWFYLTPVIYNLQLVPARLARLFALNPMAGLIDSYRAILMRNELPALRFVLSYSAFAAVLLVFGLTVFRRRQDLYPELV